eukprot:GCRY01000824.1.p1 GENE.GCRY01000824.1~~GCRY01000824.1.p1  ORF type:complete len:536 (+),score=144.13 GCRY01000824.1:124-1731(+)
MTTMTLFLDGETITPAQLFELSKGKTALDLTPEAWNRIEACRGVVERMLATEKPVYGLNTGLGNFQNVYLPEDKLHQLQLNLIRSHAAGTGEPLTAGRTRMLLACRINVFARGCSGIRPATVRKMVAAFNKGCLSCVPQKGTVGASGDLAPLSHLALGLLGEGKMWDPSTGTLGDAGEILKKNGLSPLELEAKEGLALINGTQLITSLTAEAIERTKSLALQADIIAGMTVEALRGNHICFDPRVHLARPHKGQQEVAARLRTLLRANKDGEHSEIFNQHVHAVQDAYTLRCIPQVHGQVYDTLEFCEKIISTEINSATDNPMVFTTSEYGEERMISGGNFHGEYPAKAADFLAISIAEVASMSERRLARLIDSNLSGPILSADQAANAYRLPSFLAENGGLNSGFMMAQCTSSALTSENKVLIHPASGDSISTSCAQEDHVSMGGFAARKALTVVENCQTIFAIELLAAVQGLEYVHKKSNTRSTPAVEAVFQLVRDAGIAPWDQDRYMSPDIEIASQLLYNNKVWEAVKPFMQ